MKPGCVPQRSMTLHSMPAPSPALWRRKSSLRLLPVVLQLYCGYCVNATARVTPSARMRASVAGVSGFAYRKAT